MSHQSNLAQYPVCEHVFEYFPDCLAFLVGFYYVPTKICCRHVEKLNKLAKHGLGPRTICFCIQASVKGTQPRLLASRINSLPIMCHTHLSFPISDSMDCNNDSSISRTKSKDKKLKDDNGRFQNRGLKVEED
ncbi:non-specific lipid-transfer protein 13-like [Quercus suber]|uniref:non-specific lipid-transfer protein 13-like n=1 Tax=Quercus suber TaxID=58331 RepID=UPI0032DF065B